MVKSTALGQLLDRRIGYIGKNSAKLAKKGGTIDQ